MKFGKHLAEQQYAPWSNEYLPYKSMKKMLKQIHGSGPSPPHVLLEGEFLRLMLRSVQEIDDFFAAKQSELGGMLQRLCTRLSGCAETPAALDLTAAGDRHSSLSDRQAILFAFKQVCGEVARLREFSRLNQLAVVKITKKHDKTSAIQIAPLIGPYLEKVHGRRGGG